MPTQHPAHPEILERVMQSDKFRLSNRWRRLHSKNAAGEAQEQALQKWHEDAQQSANLREKRLRSVPKLNYDPELPITSHREQIVELLKERQVIVVCGETGSGKSTQLPKLCLEAGLGTTGMIGHTQPRRLAARAIASRLASEMGSSVGELVGFKIRFADATKPETLVKLMTDGVLLAETQSDRFLDRYDAIIIDEAHERSLNIDFLLGILRRVLPKRPDLRVIITSATIDPDRFAKHFADDEGPAPIIEVSGRTYPVDIRYRDEEVDFETDEDDRWQVLAEAVDELCGEGPGDILTFLPTERDIRLAAKHLRGHFLRKGLDKSTDILPLYARLSNAEQNKVFQTHSGRRIVLSTNVAESSLTVPGIRYVIDTGLVRISRYAPRSKVKRLPIEAISQASANQRSGRCGRLGPGICIRLYSEEDFSKRPKFTTPEIRRSDLAAVLLQSFMLKLGPLEEFPLLDAPGAESLRDAKRTLTELSALDSEHRLTKMGRQLGGLPCDPRVGRMLLEADKRGCLAEVTIIAAAIECQDVRQRPAGQRDAADEAHQKFQDPFSDFLSYIRLWEFYEKRRKELGRSRLRRAMQNNFLSYQGFREWSDTVRQLRELLSSAGIKSGRHQLQLEKVDPIHFERAKPSKAQHSSKKSGKEPESAKPKLKRPEGYEAVHQSLLSGLLSGIAQKGERYEYKAARGLEVSLWPGSGLFQRQPRWIVSAEIVETNRRYARCNAEVDVEWIEKAGEALLKHSYSDPHWSRKAGAAMVYRRSTLFGLPVVAGKRVPLSPIDGAGARQLLIEQGLVEGDWNCREAFYQHNCELVADVHELVQRTRSRDYIIDRYHLASFYNQRLPLNIVDLHSLRQWAQKEQGSESENSLWMQPEDLLTQQVGDVAADFPNELKVGQSEFPLDYHFEPGHASDGVTATIPQAALRQVSPDSLGWLVPGLLEEKILHLIRSLPKSLRTNFVPAPDVAKKLAKQLSQVAHNQPFNEALCSAMREHAAAHQQVPTQSVRASDFQIEKLPPHLQFAIRVVDDNGEVLDESRDILDLQQRFGGSEKATVPQGSEDDWSDQVVTPQAFPEIPAQILTERGGVLVAMYPALIDLGEKVELRLVDTQVEADEKTRQGATRLFAQKHNRSLRNQVKHLPGFDEASLRLSHLVPTKHLKDELRDLIVRVALVDEKPTLDSVDEFEARNLQASVAISVATQEISKWLPKFAEETHSLRLKLEKMPSTWKEVRDDVRQQLKHLQPEGFLRSTSWSALNEFPRYLAAIQFRIDKLASGGLPKDRKIREPIHRAWQGYLKLRDTSHSREQGERLEQLRWMIEEFRVSVFAQKLGTKQTVSEKRIFAMIEQLTV